MKNPTKSLRNLLSGLFVAAAALLLSAFTTPDTSLQTTWHIEAIVNGNYQVTQLGECQAGNNPCQFTTALPPDQPDGTFSPEYLEENDVEVEEGTFSPM